MREWWKGRLRLYLLFIGIARRGRNSLVIHCRFVNRELSWNCRWNARGRNVFAVFAVFIQHDGSGRREWAELSSAVTISQQSE